MLSQSLWVFHRCRGLKTRPSVGISNPLIQLSLSLINTSLFHFFPFFVLRETDRTGYKCPTPQLSLNPPFPSDLSGWGWSGALSQKDTGLLGFFLNAISIVSFLTVKEMRNPSNFFVFNLAVADLCLNINGLTAAYASYLRTWPFGQDGCAFHGFQGMIAVLASISFMAAIAWDRYHQYCTRQKLFWSTTLTMSGIIWILSIFWAAVPLMGWGVYDFEPMRTCCTLDYTRGDRDYVTYMLTLVLLYLLFPAVTMLSCYDAIYKHFKKIHHYRFNTSLPLRVMLMCWGPYVLMCIYACFENVKVVSPKLRMVLPVVAKTNPIFNALLYSFGNEFYRGGVWHFLTGQKIVEPVIKKSK